MVKWQQHQQQRKKTKTARINAKDIEYINVEQCFNRFSNALSNRLIFCGENLCDRRDACIHHLGVVYLRKVRSKQQQLKQYRNVSKSTDKKHSSRLKGKQNKYILTERQRERERFRKQHEREFGQDRKVLLQKVMTVRCFFF